jgi:MtaA/CmuA family methyltransferase
MNGLERYLGVLEGRTVDFLPRLPILMQYAAEHIGSNYGAFASDHRVLVEANLRCAKDFGMDQLSAISDPYRETQGFGAEIVYVRDGVPRCPHPPLAGTKDLSQLLRPDPLKSERMRDRLDALREMVRLSAGAYSVLGWVEGPAAEAADLRGVGTFLMDLMDDGAFCAELMDLCVEVGARFARAQVEAGADTIGIGDAIASQLSPAVYGRLVQPRERLLIEAIHETGARVRLHICGDTTHLLPGMAEVGADIIDLDHMVDMAAARRILGEEIVLAGNIDPAAVRRSRDPQAIHEEMLRTYKAVGNPYMVTAGCEIPSGTPPENLRALCEPIAYSAR